MSPGDEFFAIFDWYPYSVPQPVVIEPEMSGTYMSLSLHVKEKNWNMDNALKGDHFEL